MMISARKMTRNERARQFAGICAFMAFAFLLCLGCDKSDRSARDQASTPPNATTEPKLNVVATTSIVGDWVRIVGGDNVELTTLVGPDGDPHEYEPLPSDEIAVADSKVIVENGLGLEAWLDKLYASSQSKAMRVVAANGIEVRHAPATETASISGDNPDERDPHAWQDVADAAVMVANIRDGLVKADPAHATEYRARADDYLKQLAKLDQWVRLQINTLPPRRRTLVTSHDAFGYFGQRYGVDVTRNALESVTSEALYFSRTFRIPS
jgi:zinc/manganese transport system substrate-binding protein